MDKILQFVKAKFLYLLEILLIGVFILFIIKKMPIAIILMIVHLLLSTYLLYRIYKKEKECNKKDSYLEFFSSLLSNVNHNLSFEKSYELSSKYLIGYHEIEPLDQFLDRSEFSYLKDYEEYCLQLLQDEKEKKVHLKNYHLLINKLEMDITTRKKTSRTINSLFNIITALVTTSFLIMTILRFTLYISTSYESIFVDMILSLSCLIVPTLCLVTEKSMEN